MNNVFGKLRRSFGVKTTDIRAVSSAIQRLSVKTKVTLVVTLIFLLPVLLVSAVQIYYIKAQMKTVLAEQQQASVAQVADGIDQKLVVHRDFIAAGTRTIPPEIIEDLDGLQKWAAARHGLRAIFTDVFVVSAKGVVLVDTPSGGRQGIDVSDREYFRTTVETRKPYISRPFIGRGMKQPVVIFSAPVFDKNGAVVLVLSASLNLLQPNFLGNLVEANVGKSGSFEMLTRDRTIIISRDKNRMLTKGPAPGVSSYFDRAIAGLEGTEEGVNGRGLHAIFSYAQLKVVPWVLVASLPIEEAYAPITLTQRRIAGFTVLLAFVLAPVIWIGTRRLLRPLLALRDTIHRIRVDPRTAEEVTVGRPDEIGVLANDFNALMRERRQAESALRASEADFRDMLEERVQARTAELAAANARVAHNEQRFRATIESAPTGMVMIDAAGAIVLVNAQAEKLFGYVREELLGQPVEMLIPNRFRDAHPGMRGGFFAAPHARQMGAGCELYGLRKDGSEIPVEIGLSPVQTDEGLLVLSAIVDISERKRTEQRFRATIESAPTAMVMVDGGGTIALVNGQTESLFGYAREELLGRPVEMLLPERFRHAHARMRHGFFAAPRARMGSGRELYCLRKDGREIPVEIGLSPVQTEGELLVLSSIVDISDRRRAEELRERLAAVVDSSDDAIVTKTLEGVITSWNQGAARVFGYSPGEAVGRSITILIPPERAGEEPHILSRVARGDHIVNFETVRVRKDGIHVNMSATISPIKGSDGQIVGASKIARDITERKRQAEALERSNIELQRFAYVASHDLQTPMRSVASFVGLLQSTYADKLDAQANDWIRRTVESIKHLHTMIRDLLEYSRVDAQAHPFERVPFREVFDHAVMLLDVSVREAHAEVSCGELPVVMGDRSQLVQLMLNLIGNGIKYRGADPPQIQVSAEHRGNEWKFAVQDNGIGIAPRHFERIFEIFKRLHDQREYPGSGIGLAVCRRVVHRHGGRVWVESGSGSGSVFYFTIPEKRANVP